MFSITIGKNKRHSFIGFFLILLLTVSPGVVQGAFDPVNDDTDLFLTNPNVASDRPNVLIILDNTANWNQAFSNEKSALVSVVESLNDIYNVGLMMFHETGGSDDNVVGSYVRYAVRQMTEENKAVLSSVVNGLDIIGDKSNNAVTALGMYEAYLYYAGAASYASYGKAKTDYQGNSSNPANSLGDHALGSSPNSSTPFNSPISNGCQKNFIIYISNGPANENSSVLQTSENVLANLTGNSPPNVISITPDGQEGNWGDEWAEYMANSDVNDDIGETQNVFTYTLEVDPGTTGGGPDMTALLKSMANKGKGRYFAVSSSNNGQAIVNALNQIFQEVQSVNSVFAATTLPVSVNVRGTNLNQVYVGMFRPDSQKLPRWYGNLKCYQLGLDDSTGELYLTDVNDVKAENSTTGFVTNNATSFWTESSNFWSFRPAEDNGSGGNSDLPDGDLVEKGGVAQKLRTDFATSQAGRNLLTCTGTCLTDGTLTDFNTDNSDITSASLLLDVQSVSALSGLQTQEITSLSDIKSVSSLSTASNPVAVSSLDNGATSQTISSLSSSVSKAISNLTNNPVVQTISGITRYANKVAEATVNGHGYYTGQVVTIAAAGCSGSYVGTFTVSVVDTNRFRYAIPSGNPGACGGGTATTTSTINTATIASHGFSSGQSVTIAGVTPSDFNGTWTITVIDSDSFKFTSAAPLGVPTIFGTATGQSTTATATTSSAHGYSFGDSITIAGATPTGYNGAVTITSVPTTTTFTYALSSSLATASGTITAAQGSTTVTATTSAAHGYSSGDTVTISGATPIGYNGSYSITVTGTTTFTYETATTLTSHTGSGVIASSGVSNSATAVVDSHGFTSGDWVTIAGASPSDYNGSYSIVKVDDDTFTYTLATTPTAATGTITARLSSNTAFASLGGHGYSTGDSITISGASPAVYNGQFTITKIDDDNFSYPLTSSPQESASGTITAGVASTQASATAISHGFTTGTDVTIAGASPGAFNGTYTITVTDSDSFYYTIASAQGTASGTITAEEVGAGVYVSARDDLINWVRGTDNFSDENSNSSSTDVRATIHNDVLHSKPAIINYNRFGDDNDIMVFYGANDGVFRGVKGGFDSTTGEPDPGAEVWGFIPTEFFGQLKRLRNNDPIISSSSKKPYFADGTISTYILDNNGDGILKPTSVDGDLVYLFISMRRGGRLLYALDVSTPSDPKFLWKRDHNDFPELGYTWSDPTVVTNLEAGSDPVLIFGAGYDPVVEDVPPEDITAVSSTTVTAGTAIYTRSMGRGVFVLNALTGDLLWQAGPPASDPGLGTYTYLQVSGMDYSVPGAVTVLRDRNSNNIVNRGYFGDTGGNVWRIDMKVDFDNWTVTKLAAVADTTTIPAGLRKFLYAPDVVYGDGYDAVLLSSGDREHPLDVSVENRMYMFKDQAIGTTAAVDSVGISLSWPLTEGSLYDATTNCIGDVADCVGETQSDAQTLLDGQRGWYIPLAAGEKGVGNAITLNNVTFFNTHQPASVATSVSCVSDLGVARSYQIAFQNATSMSDRNQDGEEKAEDRAQVHSGGGFLPPPTPVIVDIDGKTVIGVVSGITVSSPPGIQLGARVRRFWFKEID
ncbi:MAG: hypothetical protein HQL70_05200 [Magnetococcales bacterium]|nr:hypothetical protein [Magnetococcales bacterium]